MFLAINYKLGQYITYQYALFFIIGGAALLIFEQFFMKKDGDWTIGWPAIVKTIAYILLFLGVQVYLIAYVETQWLWFLIAGTLIYIYHDKIVDMLVPKEREDNRNFSGGLL